MTNRLLAASLLIAACLPAFAGTITVTCIVNNDTQTQTDPSSASCAAQIQNVQMSSADGTAMPGYLSGDVSVDSTLSCCPSAYSYADFNLDLDVDTALAWVVSVDIDGPYSYVSLQLGGVAEYYTQSGTYFINEDLAPGSYSFSAEAYVSDQGGASYVADPPISQTPEPGTWMAGLLLVATLWGVKGGSE